MLRFAVDGLTSFSYVPLQLSSWLGFLVSLFACFYIVVVLVLKVLQINVSGWTTMMIFILLLGGVQLIMIGVLGEYLGRIYEELKHRPLYLVAEEVGGDRWSPPGPPAEVGGEDPPAETAANG